MQMVEPDAFHIGPLDSGHGKMVHVLFADGHVERVNGDDQETMKAIRKRPWLSWLSSAYGKSFRPRCASMNQASSSFFPNFAYGRGWVVLYR